MKTVSDYLKTLTESEGAVNTISSGAVETTPTPGKVQKRKVQESDAYEGENPLADNAGKFPLVQGATAPDVDTSDKAAHMFHAKQDHQGYTG